jgi:acetyl-CoA C-acetyltransferase
MKYADAAIPAGMVWSSPFAKWQGSLAEVSSLDVAAAVTARALSERGVDAAELSAVVLGWSVPQPDIFYGGPLLAARIGAERATGAMVSQACATSVACLQVAASSLAGEGDVQLVVATDRTSNGPTLSYPRPSAQGGAPRTTHWVLDSFAKDPWAGQGMLAAGDLVAAEHGFTRGEADAVKVLRWEQYATSLEDDRAFQRRYQVPVEIPDRRGSLVVAEDEGIRPVDADLIGKLDTVSPDGVHTFATQTHPADGCAGAVVTSTRRARELAGGEGVVRLLATGTARVAKSHMPEAPVPAANRALDAAGLTWDDIDLVTTHNPFAVNDLYLAQQTGFALDRMNVRGSSLVFGHPQGPTGLRSIAELVEELRIRGGGRGLFTGCAAGDTGMALVVEVTD